MTRPPDEPRSDPRAQPDDLTSEPTTDPMTDPVETNAMNSDDRTESTRDVPDPTADPVADPAAGTGAGDPTADPTADPSSGPTARPTSGPTTGPAATTEIPATSTQALPSGAPFRVEPSAPVPDDVVAPGSELPHLPPPAAAAQPAPQPIPVPQAVPRPAIVTVNKGPRPATVMLGLLAVLVAAYLLLANLTHVDLGFAVSGPTFVGAFGGILLLVGLAGVVTGRLRRR